MHLLKQKLLFHKKINTILKEICNFIILVYVVMLFISQCVPISIQYLITYYHIYHIMFVKANEKILL